jgi:hypothetical protein
VAQNSVQELYLVNIYMKFLVPQILGVLLDWLLHGVSYIILAGISKRLRPLSL